MMKKFKAIHDLLDQDYGAGSDNPHTYPMRASVWYDEKTGEEISITTYFNKNIIVDYFAPETPARLGDVFGARQVWVELCHPQSEGPARVENDWKNFLSHAPDDRLRDQARKAFEAAVVRTRELAADPAYWKQVCLGGGINLKGWEEELANFDWLRAIR